MQIFVITLIYIITPILQAKYCSCNRRLDRVKNVTGIVRDLVLYVENSLDTSQSSTFANHNFQPCEPCTCKSMLRNYISKVHWSTNRDSEFCKKKAKIVTCLLQNFVYDGIIVC